MNRTRLTKAIIAVIVIGSAAGYLLYEAVQSSWVYYYSVDEFVEGWMQSGDSARKADNSRIIRLAGRVSGIVTDNQKRQLDFQLAGQKSSVPVRFYGPVPKNFAVGKEVVVEGKAAADGLFLAERILTRCESKYKVRLKSQD